VGLRLVHAFKQFSKLEYVFFSHAVPHFEDVPFNLPLVTLTSILRLPDDASGGHSRSAAKVTPGFAGKARSSLLFCETKTTDATERRIKKMSDNREADKKF